MAWILMIYLLFTAQGGIYRDQLFKLQDQWLAPQSKAEQVANKPKVQAKVRMLASEK